jgi:hypothetical protein
LDPLTIQAFDLPTCLLKSHLATKTFSLFSVTMKTQHIIVENNPTPLKMGFAHGIFMTQSPKTCG